MSDGSIVVVDFAWGLRCTRGNAFYICYMHTPPLLHWSNNMQSIILPWRKENYTLFHVQKFYQRNINNSAGFLTISGHLKPEVDD